MDTMKNMTVTGKLIALAGISAFFLIGICVLSISNSKVLERDLRILATERIPALQNSLGIETVIAEISSAKRGLMLPRFAGEIGKAERVVLGDKEGEINDLLKEYEQTSKTNEEAGDWAELKQSIGQWKTNHQQFMALFEEAAKLRDSGAKRDSGRLRELEDKLHANLVTDAKLLADVMSKVVLLSGAVIRSSVDAKEQSLVRANRTVRITGFMGLLCVFLSILLSFRIGKSITQKLGKDPAEIAKVIDMVSAGNFVLNLDSKVSFGVYGKIREMVTHLQDKVALADHIAANDLTRDVRLSSAEDQLGLSLQQMTGNLRATVASIRQAVDQIEGGAGQISSASQALSQGATEQASSVEEISSTMTEISSQTKLNAENSAQANGLAKVSRTAAEQGDRDLQDTVAAMTEINQSSQQIAKIIKVIDDIAFQTNLLALNAAVEAARAGKHGKGFAVVADEVRNLASRSAKAAKETAELIESSSRKVDAGLGRVRQTSASFAEILKNTVKVSDLIGAIATASNEQAQGLIQVSSALNQVSEVTQRNTASAEETASSAEELSSQARDLRDLLAQFRLREAESEPSSAPLIAQASARKALEFTGGS